MVKKSCKNETGLSASLPTCPPWHIIVCFHFEIKICLSVVTGCVRKGRKNGCSKSSFVSDLTISSIVFGMTHLLLHVHHHLLHLLLLSFGYCMETRRVPQVNWITIFYLLGCLFTNGNILWSSHLQKYILVEKKQLQKCKILKNPPFWVKCIKIFSIQTLKYLIFQS